MEKSNLKPAFQKLRAERTDDIIEGLNQIEWKIEGSRGKDLNEAILALYSFFYIDLFDRPDLEPAADRAFVVGAGAEETMKYLN